MCTTSSSTRRTAARIWSSSPDRRLRVARAWTARRLDERVWVPGRRGEEANEPADGRAGRRPPDHLQLQPQRRVEGPGRDTLDPLVIGDPEDPHRDARASGDG